MRYTLTKEKNCLPFFNARTLMSMLAAEKNHDVEKAGLLLINFTFFSEKSFLHFP